MSSPTLQNWLQSYAEFQPFREVNVEQEFPLSLVVNKATYHTFAHIAQHITVFVLKATQTNPVQVSLTRFINKLQYLEQRLLLISLPCCNRAMLDLNLQILYSGP